MHFIVYVKSQIGEISKQVVATTKKEALFKIMRRLKREGNHKITEPMLEKSVLCEKCLDTFQNYCIH